MTLAEFSLTRRRQLGMSRRQLALAAGIPYTRVLYVESHPAARRITPDTLAALARGLDVPVETLLRAAGYLRRGAVDEAVLVALGVGDRP